MAVCNLFNRLNNASGNFMMFSQYVEDITHDYVEGDNWKVVPTKFVALNIDYSKIDRNKVTPNDEELNIGIPKYFQNCFENACAYGRENYETWAATTGGVKTKKWNSEISRNLFWNCLFDGGFLHISEYGKTKIIDEVVYYGNINMHSYNSHNGMGYGEIYCYIPTDAEHKKCQVVCITDSDPEGRKYDASNNNSLLEGHTDKYIENYNQQYYYNRDFSMSFDDDSVGELMNSLETQYNFNTIVVLYDVFRRENDKWTSLYSYIPMGMYITGMFDEKNNITNNVTKFVTTSYGTGTSYGLRLCTRFTVSPNGMILNDTDFTTDSASYNNICQLMTSMNENLSKMMDVVNSAQNTSQQYKDLLSIFKNNKTNVPYVKDINGTDYWFVNGKYVAAVGGDGLAGGCQKLAPETVQKRIDNLLDNDPDNDWSYIEDPNGCDCNPLSNYELADALGVDYDGPEYGGGSTGGDGGSGDCSECLTKHDIADPNDIADLLNREWSYPEKLVDTETYKIRFSSIDDPNSNPNSNPDDWTAQGNNNSIRLATSTLSNGTWKDWSIKRIKNEHQFGEDSYESIVFTRMNKIPPTPSGGTFENPLPSNEIWTDGIPDGSDPLWMSCKIFYNENE